MALTRAKKTQKVEALALDLAGSTSAIVGTFAKLTVSQDFELRQKVREAGGRYRVLKNKLAARASQGTGIEGALKGLKGVSSVAYTSGDPVALAKALTAWVKDNAQFTFKLGIIDGKLITVDEVQSLATMPGKSEIYAKLLFLISAPAQRLVTVMNAAGRDLAVVINQGVEKGKFAEGATAASSAAALVEAAAVAVPAPGAEAAPQAPAIEAPDTVALASEVAAVEQSDVKAGDPSAESGATNAADAIEFPGTAASTEPVLSEPAVSEPVLSEAAAVEPEIEVSEAPAPAEGPAAEGAEAESQPTQAEEAAGETPAEG